MPFTHTIIKYYYSTIKRNECNKALYLVKKARTNDNILVDSIYKIGKFIESNQWFFKEVEKTGAGQHFFGGKGE